MNHSKPWYALLSPLGTLRPEVQTNQPSHRRHWLAMSHGAVGTTCRGITCTKQHASSKVSLTNKRTSRIERHLSAPGN